MTKQEVPVCGLAAVQAVYSKSPDTIKRLFFDYATGRKVARISSHLAKTRKVYRVVEAHELEKIAGTVHHGGIVAIIDQPAPRTPTAADLAGWACAGEPLLVLDRVGNAHNLGAIIRTAAFFGLSRIILADSPQQAKATEAAHRVAEGGMMHVELYSVGGLAGWCAQLASAYAVVGTAVAGAQPLSKLSRQLRSTSRPVALVLGNEEHGLAPDVLAACTHRVTIPGSGKVESLNVSTAAAILIWEFCAREC